MPFPSRKPWLALLCSFLPLAAQAGVYEWSSEKAYYVFNRKTCKDVDHASIQEKLRTAVAATCEVGALHEANLILNNTEDLSDALFFEAARQELFEQTSCSVKKVDALMATPAAFNLFKDSIRAKIPELKKLERELRDLDGYIGHYEETLPRLPLTGVGEDGKEILPPDDGWNNERKMLAEMKVKREKVKEAHEAFLDTIPFSSYGFVKSAIEKMPPDPAKNERTAKDFDKAVFKMMKELQERLPAQVKLAHPGQTLSTTAKEDVVQDEDFFNAVLDKYPLSKEEKENFGCRLDSRYGEGRESLDNVLIIGSTVAFGPWGALGGGGRAAVTGAATAAKAAAGAQRLKAVGTGLGRALRLAATGLLVVDGVRDVERFCKLSSPDHHSTAEGKHTAPGCGADDVIEELYEKDCASYFIFWGLALNGSRKAQKVLGSELLRKVDAHGINISDKLLNAGITKDMLEMYVLPDPEEDAKKEKKEAAKKGKDGKAGEEEGDDEEEEDEKASAPGAADKAKPDESDDEDEDEEEAKPAPAPAKPAKAAAKPAPAVKPKAVPATKPKAVPLPPPRPKSLKPESKR
jgi:hypothetical protein